MKEKLKAVGYCYLLFLSIGFILMALIKSIDNFYVVSNLGLPSILERDALVRLKEYVNGNKTYAIFLSALFVPLIEEVIFRLWLSLKPNHIAISISVIVVSLVFRLRDLFSFNWQSVFIVITAASIYSMVFMFLRSKDTSSYIRKNIPTVLLGSISAIFFGLIHIGNFAPLNGDIWFLYPIYIVPQIILGYFAVYLRIKHGFFYALLFHALINFIAIYPKL
ncbi:type II CAAX prenyl endopeptidase Rce1 family protein [Sphingobacterium paludis]|uniref:CAAX prenyl protease-like protein n=1 Tax=Sphingobacterium paludis TaxID=1476465 RepID=A0A4R7D833_9SPHI|nr:CPBP family glutamic-type intramembrane protease [Sphingobacterium paludis]TDS16065.1 CAAX prenyl protease-like protein [Sphingobacterium paludis]